MLIVSSLPMYDLPSAMFPFLPRLNVRYQNVLQPQVKSLVLGTVREKEKCSKAKGDEGTQDEQEDKLLWEPQGRSVVGERWGTWRQSGYPASREWQKSRRGHILRFQRNMEGQASELSHVGLSYLIAAKVGPTVKLCLVPGQEGSLVHQKICIILLWKERWCHFCCAGYSELTDMGESVQATSVSMAISVPSVKATKHPTQQITSLNHIINLQKSYINSQWETGILLRLFHVSSLERGSSHHCTGTQNNMQATEL